MRWRGLEIKIVKFFRAKFSLRIFIGIRPIRISFNFATRVMEKKKQVKTEVAENLSVLRFK